MKTKIQLLLLAGLLSCSAGRSLAQLNIPTDGSDGVLDVTTNTVIDLSLAVPGLWDTNNSANAGRGVYDRDKWAIVFKYQSVNVATGATLRFLNHPTHAPVVWLVQSNVVIEGTVDVSGSPGTLSVPESLVPTEPGPGGFRGGPGGPEGVGTGLGPAGGQVNSSGAQYAGAYGNPQILPLIGGSGGGSGSSLGHRGSGGGAGGAILIACRMSVIVDGQILAESRFLDYTGTGSGGAVKLIANSVLGSGRISALSDPGALHGRTRVEATSLAPSVQIAPETIAVPPASPPVIWPPDNAPSIRIVSINSVSTPADPAAPLVNNADVAVQVNGTTQVLLETKNFPIEGVVEVRAIRKFGAAAAYTATLQSGGFTQAVWQATVTLPPGFSTFQARATAP
jgi:hypothetical protein